MIKKNGKVIIAGGGLAGISASVFLNEMGYEVELYESTPKLGGRTFSYFDKITNRVYDNGKHIFAGWYKETLKLLELLGTKDKIFMNDNLYVKFYDENKENYELDCRGIPGSAGLIKAFFKYKKLDINDIFSILKVIYACRYRTNKFLESDNLKELLENTNQTNNAIEYFWKPLSVSIFNTTTENINTKIFSKVIEEAFNDKGNLNLIIPMDSLHNIFIESAQKYFREKSVKLHLSDRIVSVQTSGNKVSYLQDINGNKIEGDAYILAVPFWKANEFTNVFGFNGKYLKPSSIITIHIFTSGDEIIREIFKDEQPMVGFLDTTIDWAFRESDNHFSVVISGTDNIKSPISGKILAECTKEEIFGICISDLIKTLKEFSFPLIENYKIIKEKRATFIADTSSDKLRPGNKSKFDNLYFAGDWTDTGFPSTIESAVRSGRICSKLIDERKY